MARVHSQAALFEIAADFFTAASAVKPLVLLLEDLHWTDQASLDLLRYLARSVAHQRLMLVATYRDDELTRRHPLQQLLPSLIREANAQRLALQRLGNAALSALIASRYPLAAADLERLTDHIEQLTEGNPFFATEALRALEDAGTLVLEDGDWRVSELDQVRVPDLVRQVITGRLERLGDDARHLLQIAAVIGHEVDIDLWVEISDTDESRLVDVLERAIEARLVEELRDSSRLRFTHALVREALYTDLISVRQRSWHRQIGEALANRSQPDPDIIATHFQRAADPRAAQWMIRGGERAQRAYAWSTAVERYEAALELLLVADSDPRERGWLQYRIARLRRFQDPRESLDLLDESLRIAAELNDRALAAASRFSVGVCRFFLGDYPAAIAGMTAGADLLEALPLEEQERLDLEPNQQGVPTITNARGFLVAALANVGYLAEALQMGETTQEAVPKATPLAELGWSHYGDRHGALGMVYALLGRVDEARDSFVRARDMYRENGHFSTQAVAAFHQLQFITLPYRTEHMSEHTQLVAEAEAAEARAAAIVAFDTGPSTVSFPLLYLDGRWDVAAANARATLESDAVSLFDHDICHVTLARVAQARGERDAGWRHVRALLPAETATDPGAVPLHDALLLQRAAIDLALDAGDLDLAETWLATQARWLEWSGVVPGRAEYQVLLARYHQLAGDVDAALAAADAAITHASDPRQPLALAMAYRTRGDLAIDRNQLDDAANDLQASLRLTESCAAPYERALTLTALARLAIAAGNNPAEMLAEARTICQRLEARPALERVIGIEQQVAGG
jgi:tetratricopeptide (TPR) repeat protein